MNYRLATILAAEAANSAATKTIDIDVQDPISQLIVQMKATNNGTTPTAHPAKIITKIELVDGSDVLFSLNGYEIQALDFYHQGKPPLNILSYFDDTQVVPLMNLNFGRWLYDPQLALDPKKFSNLQLKITHDLALGGCVPDTATLEVVAHIFDQKTVSPLGFLMAKQHYSYTLEDAAYEYIDLPTDWPIRQMIIQSLSVDKMPFEQFNEVRISEDNDKKIPVDNRVSDLLKYLIGKYGPFVETIQGITNIVAVPFFITPTYEVNAVVSGYAGSNAYFNASALYGGDIDIAANADGANMQAVIKGYAPHGALAIPFGIQEDLADWYDVTRLGSLKLRIKAGTTVGDPSTAQVLLQQLRRY